MIVLIDNYDSFTYNLVQRFGELGESVEVFRNDCVTIAAIERLSPERIVISPGPCTPREAGMSNGVLVHLSSRIPTLGVCLGHQCIGAVFGGEVVRAMRLMHGKTSLITHDGKGVYRGLPNPFTATRYHSLIVREASLPTCLVATAHSEKGELMGVRHRELPIEGVQFHPESFLTEAGTELLQNFLSSEFASRRRRAPVMTARRRRT
ncbi:MAG: aminodeoxychorismate/anthranilate synthase component II [Planctomycetes bacterium]|nr:aminodeoxychorismate/anthranilate synthase component II [Planctomycetota bacterium]MBI3848268.1 aminodeoxychorismate/anthranilate synthase component II [Planctomycetota bacterium]